MSGTSLRGILGLVSLAATTITGAALDVSGVFSDNAILQRDAVVPVWGTAPAGKKVEVRFGGQRKSSVTNAHGKWVVHLDPLAASTSERAMVVRSDNDELTFHGLLVGEVWLASGQSNMQFSLGACSQRLAEVRAAMNDPATLSVRMLRVGSPDREHPAAGLDRTKWRWIKDSPTDRPNQSAVAFFFARRLAAQLKVPIGIIETSWGGKPIEGFIPRAEFKNQEALQPILELADGNRLEELKRLEGGVWVRNSAGLPGRIFNGRIAPLAPYALRGVIWYQAESNAGVAEDPRNYRHKMRALVNGWRRTWQRPALPFYFVQLPGFREEFHGWTRVREEQRRALQIPHTGMAVTIDLRDADIHPANKIDVGERLARWPLAQCYGKEGLIPSGPLFKAVAFEGSTARVNFEYTGDGLMVARKDGLESPREAPADKLAHFELAGDDGTWHAAVAEIRGKEVVVTSPRVSIPVAVRYACSGAPANANLYNRAGLPASPFCSSLDFLPWASPEQEEQ